MSDERLGKALDLLSRIVSTECPAPDATWFREYFVLSGDHMILTEEGWVDGSFKQSYLDELRPGDEMPILDEVNAPTEEAHPNG